MAANPIARRANKAPNTLTPENRKKALDALATGISMAAAARAAGVSHETFYAHIRKDPAFAEQVKSAKDAGADRMEDALLSLGVNEKQAVPLIFLLKGRRPHIYRENVAVTGADGGPVQHVHAIRRVMIDPRNDPRVIEHEKD